MIEVPANQAGCSLPLGRQGENKAVEIEFDPAPFLKHCGPGTPSLLVMRADGCTYPVPLTLREGRLIWAVSARDTAAGGRGKAQLDWRRENTVLRSEVYATYVAPSLQADPVLPEDDSGWLEAVLSAAERAERAAQTVPELAQTAKQQITEHTENEKKALSAHAQKLEQSVANEKEVAEMLDETFCPAV